MRTWKWVMIIVVAVTALLVGAAFGPLLVGGGRLSYWNRGGMMGSGMMADWGLAPFGWIGMLMMWVFPLGVLALVILGIVWLVNSVSRPGSQTSATPAKTCPNCSGLVQADWRNCPYCGTALGA
jgi:hypothetical protein